MSVCTNTVDTTVVPVGLPCGPALNVPISPMVSPAYLHNPVGSPVSHRVGTEVPDFLLSNNSTDSPVSHRLGPSPTLILENMMGSKRLQYLDSAPVEDTVVVPVPSVRQPIRISRNFLSVAVIPVAGRKRKITA
jgi:hypothetical protein